MASRTSTARRWAHRPTCATTSTPATSSRARAGYRAHVEATAPDELAALAGELEHGPRTALLCLEQDPASCHRRVLCEALAERLPRLVVVDL
jgi:hypothetical protein